MLELNMSKARRRILILLWATLFSLVVADGVITEFVISQHLARESNPFLAEWVGDRGFLVLKAGGAALAIFILRDVSKRHYRLALTSTCVFVLVYTAIVFWNLSVYLLES